MDNVLMKFDVARQAIAEATSIDEVKQIRDKAEAVRLYVKQQGESLEMQNEIATIKLRAERKAGELLAEIERVENGKSPSSVDEPTYTEILKNNGLSYGSADRWQKIATLPEETFEEVIEETKAKGGEVTSAGMLRKAKEFNREEKRQEEIEQGADVEMPAYIAQVYHSEFQGVDIDYQSIDIILTDPPYPQKYLHLYKDLAEHATHWLKPGGLLAVMCGQSYLPDILALMTPHIDYHWTIAYLTPGGQSAQLWQRNVNTFWKPILVFSNGDYTGDWFGDVAKSQPNDNDKRFHEWGQSISGMYDLVERLSKPGQIVLDPFMGSGSTGVAALALQRHFIGIDCDEDNVNIARSRLAQVENGSS